MEGAGGGGTGGRKPVVLVVDDVPGVPKSIARANGHVADVVTANSYEQALLVVRDRRPDLALLDVCLGEASAAGSS